MIARVFMDHHKRILKFIGRHFSKDEIDSKGREWALPVIKTYYEFIALLWVNMREIEQNKK